MKSIDSRYIQLQSQFLARSETMKYNTSNDKSFFSSGVDLTIRTWRRGKISRSRQRHLALKSPSLKPTRAASTRTQHAIKTKLNSQHSIQKEKTSRIQTNTNKNKTQG
jgi:hypothetical protein